jgi:hypothetical protein
MQTPQRTKVLLLTCLLLAAASVVSYVALSGPSRATAPEDATLAASEIVEQQGGGEQRRDANGVPMDAVLDPGTKPGRVELQPRR